MNFEHYILETKGDHRTIILCLDGNPTAAEHLVGLTNKDVNKLEIQNTRDTIFVNFVTQRVIVPVSISGNQPKAMTILLPGHGRVYIKEGKAQEGNWMNCSTTNWEMTS